MEISPAKPLFFSIAEERASTTYRKKGELWVVLSEVLDH